MPMPASTAGVVTQPALRPSSIPLCIASSLCRASVSWVSRWVLETREGRVLLVDHLTLGGPNLRVGVTLGLRRGLDLSLLRLCCLPLGLSERRLPRL